GRFRSRLSAFSINRPSAAGVSNRVPSTDISIVRTLCASKPGNGTQSPEGPNEEPGARQQNQRERHFRDNQNRSGPLLPSPDAAPHASRDESGTVFEPGDAGKRRSHPEEQARGDCEDKREQEHRRVQSNCAFYSRNLAGTHGHQCPDTQGPNQEAQRSPT